MGVSSMEEVRGSSVIFAGQSRLSPLCLLVLVLERAVGDLLCLVFRIGMNGGRQMGEVR
jgi:hypothetical protein